MDKNGDGLVSRQEFEAAASKHAMFDRLTASTEFDRFESTQDGKLDLAELNQRSQERNLDTIDQHSASIDCSSVVLLLYS